MRQFKKKEEDLWKSYELITHNSIYLSKTDIQSQSVAEILTLSNNMTNVKKKKK